MAPSPRATRPPKVITPEGEEVVHFDIDALENESTAEPFYFRLGGDVFTLAAPEDADWQVIDTLTETNAGLRAFIAELMSEEDYEKFSKHRLSSRNLTALLQACNDHFGTSPGKSRPSARSSRSTRRR